jgi:hypothetical protein
VVEDLVIYSLAGKGSFDDHQIRFKGLEIGICKERRVRFQSAIWAFVFNVCRHVRLEGCYQLVVFPWFLVLMLILFCFVLVDLSSWTINVELVSITCIV